jgi:uncharacterized protein
MLTTPLPSQIDIRKLVTKGVEISVQAPLSSLPRVADLLADVDGSLSVKLQFYSDDERFRRVDGQLLGSVNMTCQRCLAPMAVEVDGQFNLAVVWSERDAERLPSYLEPLIVGEELIDLADVVSEELILGLPFVSYHNPADCSQQVGYVSGDTDAFNKAIEDAAADNPFQVLEKMKFDK